MTASPTPHKGPWSLRSSGSPSLEAHVGRSAKDLRRRAVGPQVHTARAVQTTVARGRGLPVLSRPLICFKHRSCLHSSPARRSLWLIRKRGPVSDPADATAHRGAELQAAMSSILSNPARGRPRTDFHRVRPCPFDELGETGLRLPSKRCTVPRLYGPHPPRGAQRRVDRGAVLGRCVRNAPPVGASMRSSGPSAVV